MISRWRTVSLAAMAVVLGATPVAAATEDGTGTVSGSIFLDNNGDGEQNEGEHGREGVQIQLSSDAAVLDGVTSAPDGSYEFANVPAGTWMVSVTPPPGLVVTTEAADIEVAPGHGSMAAVGLGSEIEDGPDLAVAASAAASDEPSTVEWTFGVDNLGTAPSGEPVALRLRLEGDHEVASFTGDGWGCDPSGDVVVCEQDAALDGATAAPRLAVLSTTTGAPGEVVGVVATVRGGDTADDAPLNDEDVAETTISAVAAADDDGDGTAELSDTGLETGTLLALGLGALALGAVAVRSTRRR